MSAIVSVAKNATYMKGDDNLNIQELKSEMVRHGDTNASLAAYLNLNESTLSKKINGKSDFIKREIDAIIKRYDLSVQRIFDIFFA